MRNSMSETSGNQGFPLGWMIIGIALFLALLSGKAFPQTVQKLESVGFTVSDMDKAIEPTVGGRATWATR